MNNQIYISLLSTSSCFYKVLFRAKKTNARLNKTLKLKFILMLFDSVYPPRPSDTVTKYTVYSPILLVERLFEWYWVLFCYLSYGQQNLAQKCIAFYFLRQNIRSSWFLQIPSFRHQDFIWWQLQQKSQKFKNVRVWTSIF